MILVPLVLRRRGVLRQRGTAVAYPSTSNRLTIRKEESLSTFAWVVGGATEGPDGNVELCDEDQDEDAGSESRAPDATEGPEGEFVDTVPLRLPGHAEPDVGDVDGEPGDDGRETRESQQPVEHLRSHVCHVDVRDGEEREDKEHRRRRPPGLVHVREDFRRVALFSQRHQRTRSRKDA